MATFNSQRQTTFFTKGPDLQNDTDFNSSYCDYNSDVFKEQPSYQIENEFSHIDPQAREFLGGESPLEIEIRDNPLTPHIINSQSQKMDSAETRFKIQANTIQSSDRKRQPIAMISQTNKLQKQNTTKNSCEQSLHGINSQFRAQNSCSQNTNKHQKQPLYSMIPDSVNKNLNTKNIFAKNEENNPQMRTIDSKSSGPVKAKSSAATILAQQDTNRKNQNQIISCEETDLSKQILQSQGQYSVVNLTPQKKHPIPMSPTQKPNLTSSSSQNFGPPNGGIQNKVIQNMNYINQQVNTETKEKQILNKHSSAQKATVVYNEFKYYTQNTEFANYNNKKYINVNTSGLGVQRKSEVGSLAQANSQQNFELSPGDHKIFDISSPKLSMGTSNLQALSAGSLRKQMAAHGYQNSVTDSNNLLFQKQDSESTNTEQRFKELQEYVEQLETELKQSQNKNEELKKKFKERSFIQSFEKNKKHLSDTEDSLILSEKKAQKRTSISKSNTAANTSNQNIQQSNHTQSASSIVDVKIRPISNSKLVNHNPSPTKPIAFSKSNQNAKHLDSESEALEYQVQNFNDISGSNVNQTDDENTSDNEHHHSNEEECEGCERLKQLVFQAKEAIDDLKLEIEEWREICAEKDTELRQIHHRIYNDIMGVDKKIEFNEEIQTKEFDSSRPVNVDSKRVRNFIEHNKKRIRSRSKSAVKGSENATQSNNKRSNIQSSIKKKPTLKNVKEIISDEYELYEAEDQGIQTSFQITTVNTEENSNDVQQKQNPQLYSQIHYFSNQSSGVCMTPGGENINISQFAKQNEELSQAQSEEINQLKLKNQIQEQEIQKLRQQMSQLTKQCEQFVTLATKAKRKTKKQAIDFNELKENNEIVSTLESYSILEKINEWKKEEGLLDRSRSGEDTLPQSQIPRPLKLIMDIDPSEIHEYVAKNQSSSAQPYQNEFMNVIKQEQEQLKKQQEIKYQELQKQQQEYLNLIKGI